MFGVRGIETDMNGSKVIETLLQLGQIIVDLNYPTIKSEIIEEFLLR